MSHRNGLIIPQKFRRSGHLSESTIESIEADMNELGTVFSFRMVSGCVRVVEAGDEDDKDKHRYYYREHRISFDEESTYNQWYYWHKFKTPRERVYGGSRYPVAGMTMYVETLTAAKKAVDERIARLAE